MILRYRGEWIKTNKEWSKLGFREKTKYLKEYLSGQAKYISECLKEIPGNLKDYWVGYVEVRTQDIFCGRDKPGHMEIYGLSILYGKHNCGQYISHIGRDTAERIVRDWEFSSEKRFRLCLNLGGGLSQRYVFSKRQKNMLVELLKPLLEMEWYCDDE